LKDAVKLHQLQVQHAIRPPTAKQAEKWAPEARRQVRERYGKHADGLIAEAQKLVNERSVSRRCWKRPGCRNNPAILMSVIGNIRKKAPLTVVDAEGDFARFQLIPPLLLVALDEMSDLRCDVEFH
jgi:hypothetical protein